MRERKNKGERSEGKRKDREGKVELKRVGKGK